MDTRILFVDDEPEVLASLQRLFRRERPTWDMVFVASGAAALDTLRDGRFDLMITDLRMPRMNGAELLATVRDEFPKTVRIVLSGYADSEIFRNAWPNAHAMLSKPCDHHVLKDAIVRMLDLYGSKAA